jgi:hypothetical protein
VELPASLVPEGFQENSEVLVAALPAIQNASILNVEPLTVEDWELLETRAEFLEDGAMLRQVTVVYSEEKLRLWVGGKDLAWVRVLPENFSTQDNVWPDLDFSGSLCSPSSCLRLVADTRVCVVPKPKRSRPRASPPLRVYPTMDDYSEPMNGLALSIDKKQVRTSPGTALIHPDTLVQLPGWNQDDSAGVVCLWNAFHGQETPSADQRKTILVQIIPCKDVPVEHIGE